MDYLGGSDVITQVLESKKISFYKRNAQRDVNLPVLKMEEGATNQGMQVASRRAVPNLFDTKDQFHERQFFHRWGGGDWHRW